jgi:hypothetical protein
MYDLKRIGDELHFRGELVAILAQSGTTATTMGEFTDMLEGLSDDMPAPCDCAHMQECTNYKAENSSNTNNATFEEVMRDLTHNLTPHARGGLLTFEVIQQVVKQLIEEKGLE